ncbi:MAG: Ig-like domain-containing protein, partial [Muribaculaceae bacterium]|nr:Ig-like domain-containing protein [Muribaculaceae bacterium]
TLTFRFQTPGDKTVSLTVENGSGIQWTSSKSFKVAPLNFTENDQDFSKVIDLDGDGYGEVFSFGKFYTENDEGVYESVKKSFNSATGLSSHTYMADVNSDGLMDMFYRDIFLINYGDGDMEQVTKAYEKDHKWQIYDFNNDGLKDVSPRLLNAGDYTSAVNSNVTFDPPAASFGFYPANMYYYDYNGDGLVDVGMIAAVSSTLFSDRLPFHIYENIDGYSFKKGVEIPSITSEPAMVDDLDGDGKADFVMCDASYAFGVTFYGEYIVIIWGSGAPATKIQCPDGDPFSYITGAFDFNNDGMKDLSACLQNSNKVVVLHRDGSYEFVDAKYSVNPDAVTRRHNGNLIFTNSTLLSESNQRPTAPTDLRSSQNNGAVVIEWNAGTDKETPTTALRYNIGIKRKGAEGEGAFFISPMNGLNAQCALPSDMYLLTSPRIKIPVASIPAGEYEVSVQTVDGQYDTSEFSEIYELTVRTSAVVDMPSSGMIGSAVAVKIMTNAAASDIDFGTDAKVMSEIGNTRNVVWNSEGLKEIKVNGEKVGGIYIYPAPEANFTLPEKVVEGALVHVTGTAVDKGVWEIGTADGKFTILSPEAPANVESIGTDTLSVRFNGIGILTLRHTIEESYGSAVCERTAEVGGGVPSIDMVTAQDQYHQILWNVESVPADALAVRVYRESARYNVFDVVAELPVTSGEYVDFKSDVAVKSTRYRLSYVMPYGESTLSAAHQPMHLQVNRGQATSINLSWSRYEGMEVDSYRILKGSDASNLSTLDVGSGHLTSFTDLSDDASTSYYSVEVVPLAEDSQSRRTSAKFASGAIASRSNVVSGRDARAIVQAEQVIVTSTTGSPEFNGAPVLQLQARMLPTNASITKVNWTMVEGDDIMSVDAYGNVTAMAYGEATVRAIATDGSGAYGDIRLVNSAIPLTWLEFTAWPVNHTLATGETFQYQIKTEPLNASEKPLWESSDTEVAEITQEGLVTALRPGETDIYVRSQLDPSMLISLPLTVIRSADFVNVTSITFDVNDISGVPGDVFDLTVKVLPDNATDKRVEWHMLPKTTDVATVDADGRLTITGTGSAYVSAVSVSNPTVVATLKVNGVSGLESVFYDNDVRCDVYNTSGILLLRQASREDVERLQPGIYIAGGRKICVLPRI